MAEFEGKQFFTCDEVNALIPCLEEHMQNFWTLRENAQAILQKVRKNVKESPEETPKEIAGQQLKTSQAHYLLERSKKEIQAIVEIGAVVKDLEIGLVDFPHILGAQEEVVFLCWKYGEKKVRFYHSLHEGFVSRKPLLRKLNNL